jgi:hypothetical protein
MRLEDGIVYADGRGRHKSAQGAKFEFQLIPFASRDRADWHARNSSAAV